jgi:hypothetical protein
MKGPHGISAMGVVKRIEVILFGHRRSCRTIGADRAGQNGERFELEI